MSDSGTSDDDITADDPLLALAATLVDDTPLAPYSPPSSDRGSPSSPMLLERKSALERRKRLAARAALSEPGMLEALLQPTALQSWLPPSSPLKEIAEVAAASASGRARCSATDASAASQLRNVLLRPSNVPGARPSLRTIAACWLVSCA